MGEPAAYPMGAGAPPVCPRHPDRISYVRCQRCHRPVCPECQRPAAVGVQCVDCVAEAARADRRTTTVLGGRPSAGGPVVTMGLMGLCVALWLAQQVSPRVFQDLAFAPGVGEDEPWRFLTSAFLHGPLVHILFNMLALWMLGPYAEALLGRARYLTLYLLSALGGSVAYLLLTPLSSTSGLVGASGAVFGLFGAIIVLNRARGVGTQGIWVNLAINAALPLIYHQIAWQAHLGGFLTGLVTAFVLSRSRKSPALAWGGTAAVTALVVGLAVARYVAG